jgi:hypothetical protein
MNSRREKNGDLFQYQRLKPPALAGELSATMLRAEYRKVSNKQAFQIGRFVQ